MGKRTINKSISDATEDIIINAIGTNGKMTGSISDILLSKYPGMKNKHFEHSFCNIVRYGRSHVLGNTFKYRTPDNSENSVICNIYCNSLDSNHTKSDTMRYLELGLIEIKKYARDNNLSIAIPRGITTITMGCNWEDIESLIDKIFKNTVYSLYIGGEI